MAFHVSTNSHYLQPLVINKLHFRTTRATCLKMLALLVPVFLFCFCYLLGLSGNASAHPVPSVFQTHMQATGPQYDH